MSFLAGIFYVAAIGTSGFYFITKFKMRKYIFSPFMITILMQIFVYLISPRFYNDPTPWRALGITNIASMREYLDKAIVINSIALIFEIFMMMAVELGKKRVKLERSIVYTLSAKIDPGVMTLLFWLVIVLWYVVVYTFNGGIPLFNQGRGFFYNTAISPVYQALTDVITICAIYFGMRMVFNHSDHVKLIVAIMTLLFTGSRSNALLTVIVPTMIIYFYQKQITKQKTVISGKAKRRSFYHIIVLIGAVTVVGLALAFYRVGVNDITVELLINELLNGNTFSDLRDGAFILMGMHNKFPGQFFWGKTYLAGLISFIPSGLSAFRRNWSFGRVTTMRLFNMSNHFGLRGGLGMEGYLNFGFPGVALAALIAGWGYGYAEKMFNEIFLKKDHVHHKGNEYLILWIVEGMCSFFTNSGLAMTTYVDLLFLGAVILVSRRVRLRLISRRRRA